MSSTPNAAISWRWLQPVPLRHSSAAHSGHRCPARRPPARLTAAKPLPTPTASSRTASSGQTAADALRHGVLEVELNQGGRVGSTRWLRGPSHVPDVTAEIVRLVHAIAPFPSPPGFGRVQYVDTWPWDRSGRFQLDTLSEGLL